MSTHTLTATADVVTLTLNPAIDRTVMIPGFRAGAVNRVTHSQDRAGGKGINVAATLADLGVSVAAAGFLGRENAGIFERLFADKTIVDQCTRLPGETRVGIKVTASETAETTDINFPGLRPNAAALAELRAAMLAQAEPGRLFVLAGSLPPSIPVDFYADLTRELQARGATVLVDTSGEPLRRLTAGEPLPDILKPNVHELEELLNRHLPDPKAVADAAGDLLARGAKLVVVSMGADGAVFADAQGRILATPPAIEVVSTVGAGDAMVAGIVHGQVAGWDLARTARHATALSLDRLSHLDAGLSDPARIAALAEQVTVTPIG